jgi:hypothetical protein
VRGSFRVFFASPFCEPPVHFVARETWQEVRVGGVLELSLENLTNGEAFHILGFCFT